MFDTYTSIGRRQYDTSLPVVHFSASSSQVTWAHTILGCTDADSASSGCGNGVENPDDYQTKPAFLYPSIDGGVKTALFLYIIRCTL